jgi:hypothetical protein
VAQQSKLSAPPRTAVHHQPGCAALAAVTLEQLAAAQPVKGEGGAEFGLHRMQQSLVRVQQIDFHAVLVASKVNVRSQALFKAMSANSTKPNTNAGIGLQISALAFLGMARSTSRTDVHCHASVADQVQTSSKQLRLPMFRFIALACSLILAASPAMAASMQLLSDARSVQGSGTATTFVNRFFNDGTNTVLQEVQTKVLVPVVHPPNSFGSFVASDGMSLRTAYATLDGQGAQRSLVSSSRLSFEGVADVLAVGNSDTVVGPDYTDDIRGEARGSSNSAFRTSFLLDTRQLMDFAMTSNLTLQRLNGYSFSLVGDNGFSWTDPFLTDADGNIRFTFNTQLDLAPGTYTLDAQLAAGALGANGQPRASRATAEFSLAVTAVPEPAAWQFALAGIAMLLAVRARRGRH